MAFLPSHLAAAVLEHQDVLLAGDAHVDIALAVFDRGVEIAVEVIASMRPDSGVRVPG